jgi:hypothetical protein
LNISSNRSDDSKLSIKGYKHSKLDIGDWLQIDEDDDNDNDNYKSFKEQPQTGESDEFIKEDEVCITTNYRGLRLSKLQELMKERGL